MYRTEWMFHLFAKKIAWKNSSPGKPKTMQGPENENLVAPDQFCTVAIKLATDSLEWRLWCITSLILCLVYIIEFLAFQTYASVAIYASAFLALSLGTSSLAYTIGDRKTAAACDGNVALLQHTNISGRWQIRVAISGLGIALAIAVFIFAFVQTQSDIKTVINCSLLIFLTVLSVFQYAQYAQRRFAIRILNRVMNRQPEPQNECC
jgi:hypothetical protein